jgi:redox-sensitive bicupin YhaK (pirin superfamily)
MNTLDKSVTFHKASSRGFADHGWLKACHSFSFGDYYDRQKMGFGVLRVINDDTVEAGKGFATHPHRNMEIITVPISGSLTHKDSEGNTGTITAGEIQVMSAGSGIQHSEFNSSLTEELNLLQIWIIPKSKDTKPRYDQRQFDWDKPMFTSLVSPFEGQGIQINQDALITLLNLDAAQDTVYKKHFAENLTYVFVIEGSGVIDATSVNRRDAIGFGKSRDNVSIKSNDQLKVLVLEIPDLS